MNLVVIKGQMEMEVRSKSGYGIQKAPAGRRLTLTPRRKNIGKDWPLLELIRIDLSVRGDLGFHERSLPPLPEVIGERPQGRAHS